MGLFYDEYQQKEIYNQNPFASIDQSGVENSCNRLLPAAGRRGQISSLAFAANMQEIHHQLIFAMDWCNYVSCSPLEYRSPDLPRLKPS